MAVFPSAWGPTFQWENGAGGPAIGDKVFFYVAGSNTKQNTFTDSTGSTPNQNPIILNSLGMPPNEVWWTSGALYKVVWAPSTDTDPPTSPIRTWDNLSGINDTGNIQVSEWVLYGGASTYISGTSFSVAGNQTSIFQIGRRIQTINAGGTVYSTITNSVFGAVTTVTLVNDSGILDSGLSAVYYGILSASNPSYPDFTDDHFRVVDNSDRSKKLALEISGITTGTTRTYTAVDKSGFISPVEQVLGGLNAVTATSALTISYSGPLALTFRSSTLGSGATSTVVGTPANLVISSGSTLGTINTIQSNIIVLALNNAGTIELAAVNLAGGNDLTETGVVSTTAEGGAGGADSANVIYSTTARTNVAYRVIGLIRSTQAVAGTWASTPTLVQGVGGQALTAMSSLGYGQTIQDVAGSRLPATTYYNTTGRPIFAMVALTSSAASWTIILTVNGVLVSGNSQRTAGDVGHLNFIVPPGGSYSVTSTAGVPAVNSWIELR